MKYMSEIMKIYFFPLVFFLPSQFVYAVCTIHQTGSVASQVFLIEGTGLFSEKKTRFPEIPQALDLAQQVGVPVIDCIHSFDFEHLSAFILGKPPKTLPLIATYLNLL